MLHNTSNANALKKSESSACDQVVTSKAQGRHSSFPLCYAADFLSSTKLAGDFHCENILAQFCVDGEDLWVAHKGERQDGDGVGRLQMNPNRSP